MNINDYKDTNGNVEVSETLVSDLIGGINGVVTSGSNSNGSWIRFADGSQICWVIDRTVTVDGGGFFTTTFPTDFVAQSYVVSVTPIGRWDAIHIVQNKDASYASYCGFYSFMSDGNLPTAGTNFVLNFMVAGRWK